MRWTDHALAKAARLRVPRSVVEDAVLQRHGRRTANPGAATWRVSFRGLVVAYDYPDRDDRTTARIVTLWRT